MPSFVYFEDDELSRTVLTIMLNNHLGYDKVTVFEDSRDFLGRLDAIPDVPDVIFFDIHMRPHDGFTVMKSLRNLPRYEATRMVALTASVMNEEVELLRNAGFDGVIGKPISFSTFPDLLSRILRGERVWRPV